MGFLNILARLDAATAASDQAQFDGGMAVIIEGRWKRSYKLRPEVVAERQAAAEAARFRTMVEDVHAMSQQALAIKAEIESRASAELTAMLDAVLVPAGEDRWVL